MSAYKIVGIGNENTISSLHCSVGRQAKKRVYVNREDFLRYAPDIVRRWTLYLSLSVEAYKMVSGKWVKCDIPCLNPVKGKD